MFNQRLGFTGVQFYSETVSLTMFIIMYKCKGKKTVETFFFFLISNSALMDAAKLLNEKIYANVLICDIRKRMVFPYMDCMNEGTNILEL